jgi:putative membrane protein
MNTNLPSNSFFFNRKLINIVSFAIPIAVALLIGIRTKIDLGIWTKILPHCIAIINSATALALLVGLYFIKNHQINRHRLAMSTAFALGAVFLIAYISYHISNQSTPFGGEGFVKYVYYFFLISHIGSSIVVVRFVLLAMHFALTNQIEAHKKIVKIAYPIWLYVSVTGVVVYFMISPYYKF